MSSPSFVERNHKVCPSEFPELSVIMFPSSSTGVSWISVKTSSILLPFASLSLVRTGAVSEIPFCSRRSISSLTMPWSCSDCSLNQVSYSTPKAERAVRCC